MDDLDLINMMESWTMGNGKVLPTSHLALFHVITVASTVCVPSIPMVYTGPLTWMAQGPDTRFRLLGA